MLRLSSHARRILQVLLISLVVAGPHCACAQAGPASGTATIQVTSRLVVLDVTVVDSHGNVVPNLNRSKFTITEDGATQTIRDFEGPDAHTMPTEASGQLLVRSTADLARTGSAPVNVLVIDELNTPFLQIANAQQSLRRFLEKQPDVLPVPTLFVASGNSRIVVLHDFTQSKADLLASVKQHVTQPDFDALVNRLNGGKTGSQHGFTRTLGALAELASSLRGIPAHKNVIWVGTGYSNAYDLNSASASDHDKIGGAIRLVTDRMLQSRMSLSTLDPAGVVAQITEYLNAEVDTQGQTAADFAGGPSFSFDELATSTGGRVVHGRNDLDKIVSQIADRNAQYYTLSYIPTNHSSDPLAFRHIHIGLSDPSLRAITRTGYYPGADEVAAIAPNSVKKQPQMVRFDLLEAARNQLVYTGLHVAAKATQTGYLIMVNARDLSWSSQSDGSRTAEVSVVAVAYDRKGKELGQHASEMKQQIGPADRIDLGQSVGLGFSFRAPANTARTRLVVRDATSGNLGSVDVVR